MRDDATLLRRYLEDHAQNAFTELVRRNMDAVYSTALRRVGGDGHLAQDVAQEVFVILARRTAELAHHPVLSGWLHTTTRNVAANMVRGECRRRLREQEAQAMHETDIPGKHDSGWDQVGPVLDEVIDELNEGDRLAVLLRYFHRQSFAEMGRVLHVSEDAARMRLARSMEKLRAALARRNITSSAAAFGVLLSGHAVSAAPAGLAKAAAGAAWKAGPGTAVASAPGVWALSGATGVLLAALLGAMVIFAAARRAVQGAEAALAVANAGLAEAAVRLREAERRVRTQEQNRERLHTAVMRARAQMTRSPADRASVVLAGLALPAPGKSTASRLAGGRRTELGAAYEALYRGWGLTPEEIEDFENLAVQTSARAMWVFAVDAGNAAAIGTAPAPSPVEVEAQLQALLGDERYAQYREFNRIVPARALAARLASASYLTDPLTRTQADELTWILASSNATYLAGGDLDPVTQDWDAVLQVAKETLSPPQLTALVELRKQESLQRAMARRIARLLTPASSAPR